MLNKYYEKIKMHIMCNGGFDPNQYLETQIHKAIALAAYEKPVTIEDISMMTGIPALYLEEQLEWMIYGDAIETTKDIKYQTNFIILHKDDNERIVKNLHPLVSVLADIFEQILKKTEQEIKDIGFYSSESGITRLGYIIIPYLIRYSVEIIQEHNPKISTGPFPLRKDGGYGWFLVGEGYDEILEYESGCNSYYQNENQEETPILTYFWIGKYLSNQLNRSLKILINKKELDIISRHIDQYYKDAEFLALLIESNLLYKDDNVYKFNFPIFSIEQFIKFQSILDPYSDKIVESINDLVLKIFSEFKKIVPKRLHNQIPQYISGYTHSFTGFITGELQKRSILKIPEKDKVFTDNVFYINKRTKRIL